MAEFDRAAIKKRIESVRSRLGAHAGDEQEATRLEACLAEIDRLNKRVDTMAKVAETATNWAAEEKGYRRGLEDAAKCDPPLTEIRVPSFHFREGYEWGVESMQNAILAMMTNGTDVPVVDTPQEESGDA